MNNKNLKENWIKKRIDKELNYEEEFKKYVEYYLYKDKLTFKQLKKKLILKLDKTDSKSSKNIEKNKKTKVIENFENANLFDELKKREENYNYFR